MTPEEAEKVRQDTNRHMLEKGRLLLTVDVKTEEDVEQLMQWMYATDKPMSAELVSVGWDQAIVSHDEVALLQHMRDVLSSR